MDIDVMFPSDVIGRTLEIIEMVHRTCASACACARVCEKDRKREREGKKEGAFEVALVAALTMFVLVLC